MAEVLRSGIREARAGTRLVNLVRLRRIRFFYARLGYS